MIKYFIFAVIILLGILFGTVFYYKHEISALDQKITDLNEQNIQMEISLHLEQQRTKIMNQMYSDIQKQKEELYAEIDILKTTQVIVRDCKVKIHDVNKSIGIPKFLGSIGK